MKTDFSFSSCWRRIIPCCSCYLVQQKMYREDIHHQSCRRNWSSPQEEEQAVQACSQQAKIYLAISCLGIRLLFFFLNEIATLVDVLMFHSRRIRKKIPKKKNNNVAIFFVLSDNVPIKSDTRTTKIYLVSVKSKKSLVMYLWIKDRLNLVHDSVIKRNPILV